MARCKHGWGGDGKCPACDNKELGALVTQHRRLLAKELEIKLERNSLERSIIVLGGTVPRD